MYSVNARPVITGYSCRDVDLNLVIFGREGNNFIRLLPSAHHSLRRLISSYLKKTIDPQFTAPLGSRRASLH